MHLFKEQALQILEENSTTPNGVICLLCLIKSSCLNNNNNTVYDDIEYSIKTSYESNNIILMAKTKEMPNAIPIYEMSETPRLLGK